MPDLHGWITQQITETERIAHACTAEDWRHVGDGTIVDRDTDGWQHAPDNAVVVKAAYERVYWTCYPAHAPDADHIALNGPDAVLRRCAADRKILARHTLDPDIHYAPTCQGCGTYSDMELPVTDNLNECPELLDLAEGYGITREQLAALDQPETPARPERPDVPPPVHLNQIVKLLGARPASTVPPALRGPKWKPSTA